MFNPGKDIRAAGEAGGIVTAIPLPGNAVESGIEFEVVWVDEGVVELKIRASNGRFSGETCVYVRGIDDLKRPLAGFPSSPSDHRRLELGAGGRAALGFSCADGAGHVVVEVRLRTEPDYGGREESVILHIPVESAAIDAFCAELSRMKIEVGARVKLPSAD